jgi:hypothetical protein
MMTSFQVYINIRHTPQDKKTVNVAGRWLLLEIEELEGVAVCGLQQLLHWLFTDPRDHLCHEVHVVGNGVSSD